jgi:hypothetical protein
MSNNKRRFLTTVSSVAACFGLALAMGAGADEPMPGDRASSRSVPVGEEKYLLLTDERLIPGVISRDDSTYTVTQKLGLIRFPKRLVERSFDTIEEAYQYRLERLPEDDPGERLRLARWCLTHHLNGEAKAQLEKVLEISPDHGPAKAMLFNLARSEASRASGVETKVDRDVQQTAAEEVREDRPGALDSAVLRGAERGMGITGRPMIFDLPQAMAIRRAEEFKAFVHPVLQAYCAKCHGPEYDGPFQLVPASNARQRTPDVLRANLDATLRLIDRDNPAKSELLSSTLRPHGTVGKKRPIFPGSNNRAYQILATWVNSLRPTGMAEPGDKAGSRASTSDAEAFAADRNRAGIVPLEQIAQGIKTGDPRRLSALGNPAAQGVGARAYRYVEGQGMVPEDVLGGDPQEFPLPYMLGGPRPTAPTAAASHGEARAGAQASRAGTAPRDPAAVRGGASLPTTDADAAVPAGTDPGKPRPGASKADRVTKKKSVKIDPTILEKLLQKNANRPAGE